MVSQDKRATVQPDRAICDRQPHPGTAGFIGARRVYPIEGHTQGGDLVFWNTGPKISNGKSYSSCAVRALALKCHDHIRSCMSVSNSVSHHVLNRTGKQLRMCMNCNPVTNRRSDIAAPASRFVRRIGNHFPNNFVELHYPGSDPGALHRFHAGELQQLADQPIQAIGLALNPFHMNHALFVRVFAEQLQGNAEAGKRRTKFVRDIANQLVLHSDQGFNPVCHAVKIVHQCGNFIAFGRQAPSVLGARFKVSRSQFLRGAAELPNGHNENLREQGAKDSGKKNAGKNGKLAFKTKKPRRNLCGFYDENEGQVLIRVDANRRDDLAVPAGRDTAHNFYHAFQAEGLRFICSALHSRRYGLAAHYVPGCIEQMWSDFIYAFKPAQQRFELVALPRLISLFRRESHRGQGFLGYRVEGEVFETASQGYQSGYGENLNDPERYKDSNPKTAHDQMLRVSAKSLVERMAS